jgi:hypothetical protein
LREPSVIEVIETVGAIFSAACWPGVQGSRPPRSAVESPGERGEHSVNLFDEFFALIALLQDRRVSYAVIGGIALAIYDKPRFTRDIDLLVKQEDLAPLRRALGDRDFDQTMPAWRLETAQALIHRFAKASEEDYLVVDVLVGETPRHRKIVDAAAQLEWERGVVRVAQRADLVWLKRLRGSGQDEVDIERLTDDDQD